ncbi:transcriptional regulator, LuxR family [Catenulispora acidiphila DSM 44928]|uniref:Transcriptional regulator, LuxR family n=1 Tax=Catenulispora acidiphila (strain DSM 44928 / JCM 14897 / NBRC 102108 / NRRL B-24433 / ID139908) TaxID=479433 RepID=C7Q6G8_CATAD|nr:LuxR family transcriptional regulator [Catenulispora acidiphila]ACU74003.1 transcriptional regulator, LuxR family [Catenulispora acidiphila DSM 44928]
MPQDAKHQLLGRNRELETLDRLLREVREGRSRALVLRGEAGIGKSALLDHLAEQAASGRVGQLPPVRMQTVRTAGVEAESDFAYSALQHLCAPLLTHLDQLPQVQQDALRVAFGLSAGNAPEMLLVGVAVLGLFAEAATGAPLLCLVDDAQWLDLMSQRILAFVGRRLDAESVALVFAERVTDKQTEDGFSGLPALSIGGLGDAEARALLDAVLPGPVEARVRDRIVAETGGNPLALLELPRGLSAAELAFGFGGPGSAPLATRVEEGFRRRVEALPAETRTLLLVAAVEPVGDELLLWRALRLLEVGPDAAAPAQAAGLLNPGTPLRFRHPLVRSAVWHGADGATLLAVHAALAEATDADRDPDRRAWHRAHAALGPDEQVAADLERSADRALARGGRAAAASFLEQAAALSPDPSERARRALAAAQAYLKAGLPYRLPDLLAAAELGPLSPLQQADANRLRAKASAMTNSGLGAVQPLIDAARGLRDLDPAAARETCLAAFGAAIWAGRLDASGMRRAAEAARELPPSDDMGGVFLRALTAWSLEGPVAAFPLLEQALSTLTDDADLADMWPAANAAVELGDLQAWLSVTERAVGFARRTGAFSILSTALPYRAASLGYVGRLPEAWALLAEASATEEAAGAATSLVTTALLSAYRGRERSALDVIDAMERDGEQRGLGRLIGMAACSRAVLHNGLGNYPQAMESALRGMEYQDLVAYRWTCSELVEAASRADGAAAAAQARERLSDWSRAGTPWALGAHAVADALVGTADQAEDRYREAIAHFTDGGLDVFVARTRLLYGEWLRRQNRRAHAREELRAAHEACVTIGLEAFAERARRELLATGETVRKQTIGTPVLTPQEAQIARLVTAGHSNAEIGAQLFLSPRTVEWHLRKIFVKVGISSRRELDGALSAGER